MLKARHTLQYRRYLYHLLPTEKLWRYSLWLIVGGFLLFFLMMRSTLVLAQGEDPFTIYGLSIDRTATNVIDARTLAIQAAQQQAFDLLFQRLTAIGEVLPNPPSNRQLAKLVRGLEIDNERLSTVPVRYLATVTVQFSREAVYHFLDASGVVSITPPTHPFVILPLDQRTEPAILWQDWTSWHQAWREQGRNGGLVPFFVPQGTQEDRTDITAETALHADVQALNKMMRRYTANSVIVAVLHEVTQNDTTAQVQVSFARYEVTTRLTHRQTLIVDAPGANESELLDRAAKQILAILTDIWKQEMLQGDGAEANLNVTVSIQSFNEWLRMIELLKQEPSIIDYKIHSLSLRRGELILHYRGDVIYLQRSLSTLGLQLRRPQSDWNIGKVIPEDTVQDQGNADHDATMMHWTLVLGSEEAQDILFTVDSGQDIRTAPVIAVQRETLPPLD